MKSKQVMSKRLPVLGFHSWKEGEAIPCRRQQKGQDLREHRRFIWGRISDIIGMARGQLDGGLESSKEWFGQYHGFHFFKKVSWSFAEMSHFSAYKR